MLEALIAQAVATLDRGGVVALPTETVYGLAAAVDNATAVRRIFSIKGRPVDHPLIVHFAQVELVAMYASGDLTLVYQLAEHFWPGPLTVIVRKSDAVSDLVTGGQSTVALRVVDHPVTRSILERLGRAVAAPSANRFGRVSPTTAEHVRADLGDEVDLIVDGGPARIGIESTIVDVTGDVVAILRLGSVGPSAIRAALGRPVITRVGGGNVRAPGTLASHYAPATALELVFAADLQPEAERRARRGERVAILRLPSEADAAARELYATLRALDARDYDVILTALPPDAEANAAVRDRLTRAASRIAEPSKP